MRALAQLFYFLGSLPGLGIFTRIGTNLSRLSHFGRRARSAKTSLNQVTGKNEKGEEEETGEEAGEETKKTENS